MLDPLKEIQAATMRIESRLSTRTEETTYLTGGDYSRNIAAIAREEKLAESLDVFLPEWQNEIETNKIETEVKDVIGNQGELFTKTEQREEQ